MIDVQTSLFGRLRLKVEGPPAGLSKYRARNGIAPNYVHSLDSSHMVMCINTGALEGLTAMHLIHDDFGVHAADTERWWQIIRDVFVWMYTRKDWLLAWKHEIEALHEGLELPEPPSTGDLDIKEVRNSQYFFG